jgi:hypothetical protein
MRRLIAALGLALVICGQTACTPPAQETPTSANKDHEFVVGGKNSTASIRKLKKLNGRTIAELEADMRPDPEHSAGHRSEKGFLGPTEGLLDVLAADNAYVVDELGLTHQELAKHLHAIKALGGFEPKEVVYHGRRFKVELDTFKGFQLSPFLDDTKTNEDAHVENLDNGKKINYSCLVPFMIERYGFYEGKGTPYRVEPRDVIEVFDFLKEKIKKP